MSDIELVIKIDDELYDEIKNKGQGKWHCREMDNAIRQGTPLPRGHGDLIDRSELLKQPLDIAYYPSNYVKIAPPIIEADTEE